MWNDQMDHPGPRKERPLEEERVKDLASRILKDLRPLMDQPGKRTGFLGYSFGV